MGLHFLICFRRSPFCPPCVLDTPKPITRSSNLPTKTTSLHLKKLAVAAAAHGSSFSDSFGRGVDKSLDASLDCNIPHGDHEDDRVATRGSLGHGFWEASKGLSLAQRGGLESTKKPLGTSSLSKNDVGPCHLGSLENNGNGCNDSSTFVPIQESKLGSSKRASACVGGREAGVGIPLSLKMLKRRKGRGQLAAGLADVGSSLREAFSSMVFMMKTLQSHTLQIRRQLFYEEVEELLNMVQREMHMSFLWLFQQVFSCTPELMVLVMIMLADFTVYSMGNNLALAAISSSRSPLAMSSTLSDSLQGLNAVVSVNGSSESYRVDLEKNLESPPPLVDLFHTDDGRVGNGGRRDSAIAGGDDDDPPLFEELTDSRAMYSEEEMVPPEVSSMGASVAFDQLGKSQAQNPSNTDNHWYSNARELDGNVKSGAILESTGHSDYVVLQRDTMQSLVAPISVQLEGDNYSCYDRTDLVYQYAMSIDSKNSLLLANYAQFLFLVRHDHNRAEELFRRAMLADPSDSDAMGRFATFLWLVRRNLAAAEKAYRAAAFADPGNSFHAANYAHFLWHSGQ